MRFRDARFPPAPPTDSVPKQTPPAETPIRVRMGDARQSSPELDPETLSDASGHEPRSK
jgi:hypothetical protein